MASTSSAEVVPGAVTAAATPAAAAPGRGAKRRPWDEAGFRCPYLDTINRMVLDFDFEKACSVTGNNFNVYACLACGKYFQGRGKHTQAYTHALQESHHVYMNLGDGRAYCLPDSYEVVDSSLRDIQDMLSPSFTPETVAKLDTVPVYARGVDGSDYMPGLIGLNNIKNTDFVNVVIQVGPATAPTADTAHAPAGPAAAARRAPEGIRYATILEVSHTHTRCRDRIYKLTTRIVSHRSRGGGSGGGGSSSKSSSSGSSSSSQSVVGVVELALAVTASVVVFLIYFYDGVSLGENTVRDALCA